MTLGWWFILIALAALAWAVWLQYRNLHGGGGGFARRRGRSALALAVLILSLGVTHALVTGTWTPRLFQPEEDGRWRAVSIDGRAIGRGREFVVSLVDGKVSGGRDDCNDWGYSDQPPAADGARMIVTTLSLCVEEDGVREGYAAITSAPNLTTELRPDGTLRLAARGHEAIFRRCTYQLDPTGSTTNCIMDGSTPGR
jgi:hypothetical protein